MTIELRLATEKDVGLTMPLVAAYHEFEGIGTTPSERESAVRNLIAEPKFGGIWLIYSGGNLAGHIVLCRGYSIEFGGFDAFVDEFFLLPQFRGRGLGKKVLELMKTEAKALKIRALHLEVARTNENARRLYRRAGFEVREKYVLMSLELR